MSLLGIIDYLGTFVFAISGILIATRKEFDFFGASVIAFVTALGGGTLRDLLLDNHPVVWIADPNYLLIILASLVSVGLLKGKIMRLSKTLFLFDTLGISVFTIIGVQKALDANTGIAVAIIMGTMTAVFGGVIRDILCSEPPLIFRKELYATPCTLGSVLYILLKQTSLGNDEVMVITACFIIVFRLLAVRYKWVMPRFSL